MALGARIRALREAKKLTQKALADKLKIPHQNLSNYERGFRNPDYETLIKIAEFFEVTTDYLLTGKELNSSLNPHKGDLMDQALKVLDSPETFIAASDGKITPEMQEYVLEYILEELKKNKDRNK
ncbi:putative Xre family transcriptional regulator [Bacillus safensis FO-36b]|uniref:helix-turn-helix domain-containing protein n=1 Tax=Bacillus safensis TaxID=561879 RepID=UPI00045D435E|nr:helix-turn-helix transcriptional regulator [Bacillus safensis]AWI35697.1 XRE family transcriptional regulator [Bacillus safensis FO-36b]KDE26727.1 putative Xre family transcriptional regulator [Bacillus safensis FO-36b]MCM3050297.1 helix-turn-helix transcriptional regulator [Bacillus safensis]MEC1048627.1 helix-turn-helix transcriptional regulator [Bacillus safensis]